VSIRKIRVPFNKNAPFSEEMTHLQLKVLVN
jgi:hypothetical protein